MEKVLKSDALAKLVELMSEHETNEELRLYLEEAYCSVSAETCSFYDGSDALAELAGLMCEHSTNEEFMPCLTEVHNAIETGSCCSSDVAAKLIEVLREYGTSDELVSYLTEARSAIDTEYSAETLTPQQELTYRNALVHVDEHTINTV